MTRGNSREKKAVRARMAKTGENYTTALRRHREERAAAQEQRDAAGGQHDGADRD